MLHQLPVLLSHVWPQEGHVWSLHQIPWLSTEYHRQSSEGYPMKVDWSTERRVIKNKKATETHELDRFRPSIWHNTLLLWSVELYWLSYDIAWVWRGSLPALYSPGSRVTSRLDLRDNQKVITDYRNLGIIYILIDLIVSSGYLLDVLWAGPPLGAQPMWSAVGIWGCTSAPTTTNKGNINRQCVDTEFLSRAEDTCNKPEGSARWSRSA